MATNPAPPDVAKTSFTTKSNQNALFSERTDLPHTDMEVDEAADSALARHLTVSVALDHFSQITLTSAPSTPGYRVESNQAFSLLDALILQPDILLTLTTNFLSPDSLIKLYSISRSFHAHVNTRFSTYVIASVRHWARLPVSTQSFYAAATTAKPSLLEAFPFTAYPSYCIPDPTGALDLYNRNQVRIVPSFRYLQFSVYRARIVREIILLLGADGHRFPLPDAALVLAKIWFIMDMPRNAVRVGHIHNQVYWTNEALEIATMLSLKLEMRFKTPNEISTGRSKARRGQPARVGPRDELGEINAGPATGLRQMMFAQKGLTVLHKVLKRELLTTRRELFEMIARWRFEPPASLRHYSVFGVPAGEVGSLQYENWGEGMPAGEKRAILLRPDELIMREGVRRGLKLSSKYTTMMVHGFVDEDTLEDLPMPFPDMIHEIMGTKAGDDEQMSRDS